MTPVELLLMFAVVVSLLSGCVLYSEGNKARWEAVAKVKKLK